MDLHKYLSVFHEIAIYLSIPILAIILSSILCKILVITPNFKSIIQHFSAGVVFSALSVELIPELYHTAFKIQLIAGFVLGTALMLFIQWLFSNKEGHHAHKSISTLLIAVGIDIFIDGLLVGISFTISVAKGLLISIALSLELLFLVLSVDVSLQKAKKKFSTIVLTNIAFALLVLLGSTIGLLFVNASHSTLVGVTSFAAAALLYLVTEELLKEAHEEKENMFSTSMFFLGFLIILLLK
ncbi:MAG: ZIP family zinc transporter [Candidatus Midichloriaceae bacterium]